MWNDLGMTERADLMGIFLRNGIRSLDDMKHVYDGLHDTIDKVNRSDANFVKRLKDPNRKYIRDWANPDNIATHKLGVEYDEDMNPVIYPNVQEINGRLVDFTRPPYDISSGLISAIERGDTVHVNSIQEGVDFTERYKDYYPKGNTFQNGGRKWDSSRAKRERYPTLDLSGIRTTSGRPYNPGYAEYIYHAFRDSLNYTPAQTAAIVGTTIEESGADPFARSKDGTYNGLLQWSNSRYIPNPNNTDKQELDAQIHHIDSTLNAGGGHNWTHGGEGSGFNTWKEPYEGFWDESSDTDEAVDYLNWGYVRPRGKQESNENRKRTSRQVNQKVSGRYLKKFNE